MFARNAIEMRQSHCVHCMDWTKLKLTSRPQFQLPCRYPRNFPVGCRQIKLGPGQRGCHAA